MAFRLKTSVSKNSTTYYVIEDVYLNGRKSTRIAQRIGNTRELQEKYPDHNPYEWAKAYVQKLRQEDEKAKEAIIVKYKPRRLIEHGKIASYNIGYLFIQQIYYRLGLHKLCREITEKYKFTYDLNQILSYTLYARMLKPGSKRAVMQTAKQCLQTADLQLQQIYRGLSVLCKENEYIQEWLYRRSADICKRKTSILYYDLTNFYFEIEEADEQGGLRQYGLSKEGRPNPIVQLGLFIDGNGIPLAFDISSGNTNEQLTMKPLEKRIIQDFSMSEFIVCTDAGLSSLANRKFNTLGERAFVTTQSIKKLKKYLKTWALDPTGWSKFGSKERFNLDEIEYADREDDDVLYYKERWIKEGDLEQRLVVSFSSKQQRYQRYLRYKQIERAKDVIANKPSELQRKRETDYKRLAATYNVTVQGELADKKIHFLDYDKIADEEQYDGFYAVCSNLEGDVDDLLKINRGRWQIEDTFRLMKHDLKSRPVYLQREDRIKAHFLTCYITLLIYRILEKLLPNNFTVDEILGTLRQMNLQEVKGQGFAPSYIRTDLTDALHELGGFRTDYEFNTHKHLNRILKQTMKEHGMENLKA